MIKDKLTNGQQFMYNKIKHDLNKYIKEFSNKIEVVKHLVYSPKKDGTPKANFMLNFAFDVGEFYTIKWNNNLSEKRRYVNITQHFDFNHKWTGICLQTNPIWDSNHDKQIVEFLNTDVYFYWNIFEGHKPPENAKECFELIKGPFLDYLVKTCNEYNLALANFDDNFERLCIAATNLNENIKAISAPVFYSYAYNLQGRDNHYFVQNFFE